MKANEALIICSKLDKVVVLTYYYEYLPFMKEITQKIRNKIAIVASDTFLIIIYGRILAHS